MNNWINDPTVPLAPHMRNELGFYIRDGFATVYVDTVFICLLTLLDLQHLHGDSANQVQIFKQRLTKFSGSLDLTSPPKEHVFG